jgi:hypothetical protein
LPSLTPSNAPTQRLALTFPSHKGTAGGEQQAVCLRLADGNYSGMRSGDGVKRIGEILGTILNRL